VADACSGRLSRYSIKRCDRRQLAGFMAKYETDAWMLRAILSQN
jgi:hypothetical protein